MAMPSSAQDDSGKMAGFMPEGAGETGQKSGLRLLVVVLGVMVLLLGVWRIAVYSPENLMSRLSVLPRIKPVPPFELTERSGATVTRETLLGSPWVADFIFTSCPGPCPKMSQRMLAIQRALVREGVGGKLVSFSVDPERDRPSVLKTYAQRFKADADRWWFLTGDDEQSMWTLASEGFFQAVLPGDETHRVEHGTYFIVVGKNGSIRSVHQGLDPDQSVSQLIEDIVGDLRILEDEPYQAP